MKNKYQKYLLVFEQDKKWGFYINNLGRSTIEKNKDYPSKDHRDNYYFTWDKGRVLNEFQIVLITSGEGTFESKETGEIKISTGDAFLLFPNVWHRYKPLKKSGWTEQWIGFSGDLANKFIANGFFTSKSPIISKCNNEDVLNYFNTLFKLFDEETFGFQRIAAGVCMQLLAELYNVKHGGNDVKNLNSMVSYAKHHMYENINTSVDLIKIASDLGVSYSKFRLDFKKQTGVSPLQYHLLLKINKSKELLLNTNKSQKEIAFEIGFDSNFYFSRLFKQKTGMTPKQYRNYSKNK